MCALTQVVLQGIVLPQIIIGLLCIALTKHPTCIQHEDFRIVIILNISQKPVNIAFEFNTKKGLPEGRSYQMGQITTSEVRQQDPFKRRQAQSVVTYHLVQL